jgi:hypothetical protein
MFGFAAISVGAVTMLIASGCASSGTALPSPTHSASGPESTAAPSASAKSGSKIESPLNPSKYIQQPCKVLAASQVDRLGGKPESAETDSSAHTPRCTWHAKKGFGTFSISFFTTFDDGIQQFERAKRDAGTIPVIKDTSVESYPALILRGQGAKKVNGCALA